MFSVIIKIYRGIKNITNHLTKFLERFILIIITILSFFSILVGCLMFLYGVYTRDCFYCFFGIFGSIVFTKLNKML